MATQTHTIPWTHDFEAALAEARRKGTHVLLDFTAAPM